MIGNEPPSWPDLTGQAGAEPDHRVVRRRAGRQYRYRRRHTPHYFIVLTGVSGATCVCLLNLAAYLTRSITLAEVAFGSVVATALVVFTAYFWGFCMLMSGNIPVHRIKVLVPHAAVGTLSPLLYTLNISLALDDVGRRPVSGWMLACSVLCLALLGVQFGMGKAVVRPQPLRVVYGKGPKRVN